MLERFKIIVGVFRPKRWYRNAFMLLGSAMAMMMTGAGFAESIYAIGISFAAICLVAFGNYGLNEVFDAESDQFHPQKRLRALPAGRISSFLVLLVALLLYALGLSLALSLGNLWVVCSLALFIFTTGILYNIPPARLKDIPYADAILEAFGNPARLLVGWYAVTSRIVPVSFLLIFWCLGAVLMAGKRLAELRYLAGHGEAGLYRKSLGHYTEQKLLFIMIAAALILLYMFGVLSVKHEIDLVMLMPLVVVFILWFIYLVFQPNSIAADPERIFENWPFVLYSIFLASAFFLIFYFKPNYFSFFLH